MVVTIRTSWRSPLATLGCLAGLALPAAAQAQSIDELGKLSIEDLGNVVVTSASKRAEPLAGVSAALYVIGQEDLRRSTATSLPEALRLAPNLNVQRIDARQYSVSSRGFSGLETSNKLLVMIDGRSVYSTLFSSVFWELHQVMLDDLDRIEVISGPGGSLYGANAVNGVINVTSRTAANTQGGLIRAEAGTRERTAAVRYGGRIGSEGHYRVYATGFDREGLPDGRGGGFDDGGRGWRIGFRADTPTDAAAVTVQGDLFRHHNSNGGHDDGQNLLARWTHPVGSADTIEVQAYYDRTARVAPRVVDALTTYDAAVQGNFVRGTHTLVVGAGVRFTDDRFDNTENAFTLDPPSRTIFIGNVFAQDDWAVSDTVTLTAGLKLEKTSFTGLMPLPNARVAWRPNDATLLWGAVSRAIRTPSRVDRNLVFPGILVAGTFESEKLTAIEAGYRGQISSTLSLSVSAFYNLYDDLRSTAFTPVTFFPLRLANGQAGRNYGVEAWGSARVASWWRLDAGVSALAKDFAQKPGEFDIENGISLGNDPDFLAQLRSRMDLGRSVSLDVALRGVDSLPNPRTRGYVNADIRIGWRASPTVELYLSGTDLLHKRLDESGDTDRGQAVVRRIQAGIRTMF